MDTCYFKSLSWLCKQESDKPLSNCGQARIRTIVECSKIRGDGLNVDLEKEVAKNSNYSIVCHRDCVSTYTSKSHIKRHLTNTNDHSSSTVPPRKRTSRSDLPSFDFKTCCLFCGEVCQLLPDPRNPTRWKKVVQCRTADRGGTHDFKQRILEVCRERNDEQANQVQVRVEGAISDLHAADAIYHLACSKSFMCRRSVNTALRKQEHDTEYVDEAFKFVISELKKDQTRIWNAVEIYHLYLEHEGCHLSRKRLISELVSHCGTDLLVLSGNGIANLLVFRSKASSTLRLIDDEEDDVSASVEKVAKQIVEECKYFKSSCSSYETRINLEDANEWCSQTLMSLLKLISKKLDSSKPTALIGNIITSIVTNQASTLQVALALMLRDKGLIMEFSKFGVCCSYDEILRFKASAAAAAHEQSNLRGLMSSESGLVQTVADNFDANISSANGLRSTHALALLVTQVNNKHIPDIAEAQDTGGDTSIKRLKKEDMKTKLPQQAILHRYQGPKRPEMPHQQVVRHVLPLKILVSQVISSNRAKDVDFTFLQMVTHNPETPEYGGFNTMLSRQQGQSIKPATIAVYTPLIDMVPSDPDTMMTAMMEAKRLTEQTGQTITIFTADQQLYRVVVDITWVYPDLFVNFIPRLGGMHLLMSFIGCIGTLMSNSGLEDIMSAAFGGVAKMLTGKKFPQNCRALRMVTEEILLEILANAESYTDLMVELERRATESRTSKLWLDNLIKPTFIMMQFVRAEREADWPLHLLSVEMMMPYFFSAGHTNYARYGLYYLRSMQRLPFSVQQRFLQGDHVMRHKPGIWNAIWSDMYIETTFMRYGHGPGGIIGITLEPATLSRWALSLHICSRLIRDVSLMSEDPDEDVTRHKEELPHRIQADNNDRKKIGTKIRNGMNPLDPKEHPPGLINVVTGRIAPNNVNVDQAIALGQTQMKEFESTWPEGFHSTISKKIITMSAMKKNIKVGSCQIYDTNLIYSRVIGLQASRDINMKDVLEYELCPVPASLFDENGDMRIAKSKSTLKNKLQVQHSGRQVQRPDKVLIDGCALLWVIHYPKNGTVLDYAENVTEYVSRLLAESDVFLIFDRYYSQSIKNGTRLARSGDGSTRQHVLNLQTPLPAQKVALTVTENKVQLIDIICKHLKNKFCMNPSRNALVVTGKDPVPFEIKNGTLAQRDDYRTTHEEADVIIVQQVVKLANAGASSLNVICDDTDVFVLLVHFYIQENLSCKLFMSGTSTNRRTIDIKETAKKHSQIADQLLPAHALTGCDTVSQLYRVGKTTAVKMINSGHPLNQLGVPTADLESVLNQAVKFIAACYGFPGVNSMSDARYEAWTSKMANKKLTSAPELKVLPPTSDAFKLHVYRAHLQAAIWRYAILPNPPDLPPTQYGWNLDAATQTLEPSTLPLDVSPAPLDVLQLIKCGCAAANPCSTARCGCYAAHIRCSMFCACHGECKNCTADRLQDEQEDNDEEETNDSDDSDE